jgi:hypothetical protein
VLRPRLRVAICRTPVGHRGGAGDDNCSVTFRSPRICAIYSKGYRLYASLRSSDLKLRSDSRSEAPDMPFTILGAALIAVGCASFWYLLPRNGKTHPLVENSDIGSMVTIGIMTVVTVGSVFLAAGIFG